MGSGYLTIKASMENDTVPIEGADVLIQDANKRTLYTLKTDASGKTEPVMLYAPDKIYSLNPNYNGMPYSTYRVKVSHPGFVNEIVNGVQIFDTVESLQNLNMTPLVQGENPNHVINIPPHRQVLRMPQSQPGLISRTAGRASERVIIPDFITVHLGKYNQSARNIRVPFPLYIKNVKYKNNQTAQGISSGADFSALVA